MGKEGTDMKLTSINCPNCNGQLKEENGKFICMSCGGAFAIDYDEADVEHEKLQTEAERERIRIEREKELMATKIRLEEEAQMRRAERTRKAATSGILKIFLIPICIMLVMSIGSMIFFGIIGKRVSKRATNWMTNSTKATVATTATKPTDRVITPELILNDKSFIENAIASGVSCAKAKHSKIINDFDLKTELNLDMVPQASLVEEPKLVHAYFIESDNRYFVMVFELTFGYNQDIDRTKTMYFACYLSGISRNSEGKIITDYNVQMDYGTGMDLSYSAYEDKDQLYREVVLGKNGICDDLTADLVNA